MATLRARPREIQRAALDAGLERTSGNAIAHACGLPSATINRLLAGREPNAHTLATLTQVLGATVEQLFDWVDDEPDA